MKSSGLKLVVSLVLLVTGAVLLKANLLMVSGMPYILMAVGCGLFGNSTGEMYKEHTLKNDPQAKLENDIAEKDERNVQIQLLSKAKAFDVMTFSIAALMFAFAMMSESWRIVISLVVIYLFIHGYSIFWRLKLEKEM